MKKSYKILLIDSDSFLTNLLTVKLNQKGLETVVFSDTNGDIIQRVFDFKPDLICSDILFPKCIDGFDAAKLLKTDERTKNIPIVFLTNMFQEKYINEAKQIGVVEYINKADNAPDKVVQILMNEAKKFSVVAKNL